MSKQSNGSDTDGAVSQAPSGAKFKKYRSTLSFINKLYGDEFENVFEEFVNGSPTDYVLTDSIRQQLDRLPRKVLYDCFQSVLFHLENRNKIIDEYRSHSKKLRSTLQQKQQSSSSSSSSTFSPPTSPPHQDLPDSPEPSPQLTQKEAVAETPASPVREGSLSTRNSSSIENIEALLDSESFSGEVDEAEIMKDLEDFLTSQELTLDSFPLSPPIESTSLNIRSKLAESDTDDEYDESDDEDVQRDQIFGNKDDSKQPRFKPAEKPIHIISPRNSLHASVDPLPASSSSSSSSPSLSSSPSSSSSSSSSPLSSSTPSSPSNGHHRQSASISGHQIQSLVQGPGSPLSQSHSDHKRKRSGTSEELMPQSLAASHRLPPSNLFEMPIFLNAILISDAVGFIIESGPQSYRLDPDTGEPVIEEPKNYIKSHLAVYQEHFFGKDHVNLIATDTPLGIVCVSVIREDTNIRVLVRSKNLSDIHQLIPITKEVIAALHKNWSRLLKIVEPRLGTCKFTMIEDPGLPPQLLSFANGTVSTKIKVGVLLALEGQTKEEQMFSNATETADFSDFLKCLGKKVPLQGWDKYTGGLDTKGGSTGTHTVFNTFQGFEIMFHVSTMLPLTPDDPQQVERKRHLGNDIVLIVFQEGDATPYKPVTVSSNFIHVTIVVQVAHRDNARRALSYRVWVSRKEEVDWFEPVLPDPPVFKTGVSMYNFLMAKIVNAELTSYRSPAFAKKLEQTRSSYLRMLSEQYCTKK